MNRKMSHSRITYDDVVSIVTLKHNIVAQVLKDSIGIRVVVGYCWDIVTKLSLKECNDAKFFLLRNTRR